MLLLSCFYIVVFYGRLMSQRSEYASYNVALLIWRNLPYKVLSSMFLRFCTMVY